MTLPTGTVTFLFTDIEGSTRLLHELGDRYVEALAEHRRELREAFAAHGGVEVDTQGDAFFVAFARASDAVAAATAGRAALERGPIRVRMGLHTGEPTVTAEGYVGVDVHTGARVAAAGHGGQVLLSQTTAEIVDAELRDLGLHRLKDVGEQIRLYQLGEGDFPPLRSLNQTNLPAQPTPFLGRQRELADVLALVRRAGTRLVTLTGPGGTGKTRLALESATEVVDEFADGVWWVPPQAVRDPAFVVPTIAQTVGAKGDLAAHVDDRTLLLVLDNLEHVIQAAAAVGELLARCSNLRILATSREPLRIAAEQEYAVPPLSDSEAAGFFVARARAVDPGFAGDGLVFEICRRLDNLPLALELAAARVKVLSPESLLQRLDRRLSVLTAGTRDAPERQRTLRATIEWSYELLTAGEQRLFARLAVFAGGMTLDAAETVCDADLETLASLVDKSLLAADGDRFSMLETISDYALERLEEAGDRDALGRRHAEYFAALAEALEPGPGAPEETQTLDRIERDYGNFRAALAWSAERDRSLGLRLARALGHYWYIRGNLEEGLGWLSEFGGDEAQPDATRGRAFVQASGLCRLLGRYDEAKALAEDALVLFEGCGDAEGAAMARNSLAIVLGFQGEYDGARELFEATLEFARADGNPRRVRVTLNNLGDLALQRGEYERAAELFTEALAISRELGDTEGVGLMCSNLGFASLHRGRTADARDFFVESLEVSHSLRWSAGLLNNLIGLAAVAVEEGRLERAGRLVDAADALQRESAVSPSLAEATVLERLRPSVAGIAPEQADSFDLDQVVAYARSVD